ncbi:MAG: thioredoxin family protein [Cryomorphaceae bacterium]|nr:thioredoxin family protein [Cryomorphaceae bacterium]
MKRFTTILILSVLAFFTQAQMQKDPVSWKFSMKDKGKGIHEFKAVATIEKTWHLYSSQAPDVDMGPLPTEFNIDSSETKFRIISSVSESPKPVKEFDPNFGMDVRYHSNKATFTFQIEAISTEDFTFEGYVYYMVCDDEKCLPPKSVDFDFKIPAVAKTKSTTEPVGEKPDIDYTEIDSALVEEDIPETITDEVESIETEDSAVIDEKTGKKDKEETSLLALFIFSFLGGFAALLTPCVFPMLPLTVSFFTKRSPTRAKGISNAIIYGLSIIILYVSVGYSFTAIFGVDAMNRFATDPWVNLVFFALLVVFAISFFGAFEIALPQSWANKADKASERGGLIGIFFMAFTLALVSFSCTGPIIGTLLFEAFSGGVIGPVVGMFGFSLALAIPFALFAAFPGWMNSLPKSGGWLNSVKVVLGFLELALAMKFLSVADLVWQMGILKREYFLIIWITIGIMLVIYLLGIFRLPHDSKIERLSVSRLFIVMIFMGFTVYLIPGLGGAPLGAISGITPPMWYTDLPKTKISGISDGSGALEEIPDGADPDHCPLNLNCFHDYEKGLAYAKKVNKPILLDFTGWGCVNCRKMEENVWIDSRIEKVLRNDVVVISLYVDERTKIPKEEQYYSEILGHKVRNIGNKWAEFQAKHFQNPSQPYYVFVNHDNLEPLIEPEAYNSNVNAYYNWLNRGVKAFEKQKKSP